MSKGVDLTEHLARKAAEDKIVARFEGKPCPARIWTGFNHAFRFTAEGTKRCIYCDLVRAS